MKRILLSAIAMIAVSGSAMAADALETAAPSAYNWSGGYIGGHFGYGWSDVSWVYTDFGSTAPHSGSGWLGGVQAGYNAQNGSLVYGVEGDVSWSGINGSTPCPNPDFACESKVNWLATGRGRLGFAANNILLYGTAGIAGGGVTIQTTLNPNDGTNGTHASRVGYALGGGVEWGINAHWTAKSEYMFYDLGKASYIVDNNLLVDSKVRLSTIKLGVNYKF